jgi:hypothetical protein
VLAICSKHSLDPVPESLALLDMQCDPWTTCPTAAQSKLRGCPNLCGVLHMPLPTKRSYLNDYILTGLIFI